MTQDITKNAPNPAPPNVSRLAHLLSRVGRCAEFGTMGQRFDAYVDQAEQHLACRSKDSAHVKQAVISIRMALNCMDMIEEFPKKTKYRDTLAKVFNGLLEHADMPFMRAA